MVEGRLAGLCAANSLGYIIEDFEEEKQDLIEQLDSLRAGPTGEKILNGLEKVTKVIAGRYGYVD